MVCRCRDGTYGPECCFKGGRSSRKGKSKTSPATQSNFLGASAATARKLDRVGKGLTAIGIAQYANSFNSTPYSNKIWQNVSLKQVSKKRSAHYDPYKRKNRRKYDFAPKGDNFNQYGSKDTWKGKYRKMSKREAHWKRRPVTGIYSVPSSSEIALHRRSQRGKGKMKALGGTSMRLLGKGLMIVSVATYASWLYEDPTVSTLGDITYDFLGGSLIEEANNMAGGNLSVTTPFY